MQRERTSVKKYALDEDKDHVEKLSAMFRYKYIERFIKEGGTRERGFAIWDEVSEEASIKDTAGTEGTAPTRATSGSTHTASKDTASTCQPS
jgi:hypothetical protein